MVRGGGKVCRCPFAQQLQVAPELKVGAQTKYFQEWPVPRVQEGTRLGPLTTGQEPRWNPRSLRL